MKKKRENSFDKNIKIRNYFQTCSNGLENVIKLRAAPEKKQGGGMAGVLFWLDRALKGIN